MSITKAIALLGMPGSGKSTASAHLNLLGIPTYRLGSVVVAEVVRQGLALTPQNEATVRTDLRAQFGRTVLADRALEWLNQAQAEVCVLDGVYSIDEYELFKTALQDSFTAVAILSDRERRYRRLNERLERPLTEAEAQSRDRHEIENLRKADAIVMADHFLTNNSTEAELADSVVRLLFTLPDSPLDYSPLVETLLTADLDTSIRAASERGVLGRGALTALMHRAIVSRDAMLTWHACAAIGALAATYGIPFLRWVSGQPDIELDNTSLHRIAARSIAQAGETSAFLVSALSTGGREQRAFAADALGELHATDAIPALLISVEQDELDVSLWAALSLTKMAMPTIANDLESRLRTTDGPRRLVVFDALAKIDPRRAEEFLREFSSSIPANDVAYLRARLPATT